ncbi:hypothetical protein GOHSU_16_01100 [Gordonia hirsuta DSM 44140 = NBRC 16056]|uniref:protein adenylyltransferase n=1 Tax=Gordonia hirsuta DSM 44140 = NBRC 16056 TaxID=1121927 RepID=L7LAQ9_9ACTN|nr:Fic family protein [Gordonia hirsuta]GAC57152.1 hypothetical protein GOHSU_16_01100 [Gordonia hirsuta DSM 44140 = NBRC 16056]
MANEAWEATFIPGTRVLKNRLGITDSAALDAVEQDLVYARQREIIRGTVELPLDYDSEHLQAIHRHLFGDLYPWAGVVRTYPTSKGMTTFAAPAEIADYLTAAKSVVDRTDWDHLDHGEFATRLAHVCAYLNTAHPFREGNGRTSKLFVQQLARQYGWDLDFLAVTPDQWNNASAFSGPDLGSFEPVPDTLYPVFRRILVPLTDD